MTRRRPFPTQAIAAKKATASANRERIGKAINTLRAAGQSVNVQSVAREANVSPDTVRRSGDLYEEVKRLRGSTPQWSAPGPRRNQAGEIDLRARLVSAQSEIVELRRELTAARRSAHQALGQGGARIDAATVAELRRENAELSVGMMDLQLQLEERTNGFDQLSGELLATKEINREYALELNRVRSAMDSTERELVSLRRAAQRR